jgi:hypothetical protein
MAAVLRRALGLDGLRLARSGGVAQEQWADLVETVLQYYFNRARFKRGAAKDGLVSVRDDHDADIGMCGEDGAGSLKTRNARHPNVHRYEIRVKIGRYAHGFVARIALLHRVAGCSHQVAYHSSHIRVIINNHQFHFLGG